MSLPFNSSLWRIWLVFGCGFLSLLIELFDWSESLDRLVYDSAETLAAKSPSKDLVVIAIDESSLSEFGRWPWPREKHVQLLRQLTSADVAAVVMDIIFSEPEREYPQVDDLLAAAMAENGKVVLPVFIGQSYRGSKLFEVMPVEKLAAEAAGLGHVHVEVDDDGVVRSVYLKEGVGAPRWPHISVALTEVLGGNISELPGAVNEVSAIEPLAIVRNYHNLFPVVEAGKIQTVSYADVLAGRIPLHVLRNKVVFVGATAAGLGDKLSTSVGLVPGVKINAFIFDALREKMLIQPFPEAYGALFLFLISSAIVWFSTRLKPAGFLVAITVSAAGVLLSSVLLLKVANVWLSPVPSMLSLLIAYPLWNWWRLEKAVSFLRQQLARLAEYQGPEVALRSWDSIVNSLHFLESMGCVQGWKLCNSSAEVLESSGFWEVPVESLMCQEGEASPLDQQQPISRSQFRCKDRSGVFWLFIEWTSLAGQMREKIDNVLASQVQRNEMLSLPEGEIVDRTIQQLSQVEQRVAEQRNLVDKSLGQLSSGVVLADLGGNCLLVNEQAKSLLSVENEHDRLMDLLANVDISRNEGWSGLLAELLLHSKEFSCEAVAANGADVLCCGSLVSADGPLMLFNFIDISELKRSERDRTNALNFLSHDLRAPLTSVLALIEGARSEHPNKVNSVLLDNIQSYVERNLSYAENYTQLAKLESATDLVMSDHEVHSLIDNAVAQLFHSAQAKQIQFCMPDFSEDIWLLCSHSLVERALVNLLDNAIKFSEQGCKVSIDLSRCESDVNIVISDQGPGVDSKNLNQFFSHPSETGYTGMGLGLRFVAAVCKAHQGQVRVESEQGKGSKFTLTFPCRAKGYNDLHR